MNEEEDELNYDSVKIFNFYFVHNNVDNVIKNLSEVNKEIKIKKIKLIKIYFLFKNAGFKVMRSFKNILDAKKQQIKLFTKFHVLDGFIQNSLNRLETLRKKEKFKNKKFKKFNH